MNDFIYRVVDENGEPVRRHWNSKRQHVYVSKSAAKGMASSLNTQEARIANSHRLAPRVPKVYKIQQATVTWQDCE